MAKRSNARRSGPAARRGRPRGHLGIAIVQKMELFLTGDRGNCVPTATR